MPDKYRGTQEYDRARDVMIAAARCETPLFYRPTFSEILGLDGSGDHIPAEIGRLCGEISEDEHLAGRPLLSAVAINQSEGNPGLGFFELARGLELFDGESEDDEMEYWINELNEVRRYWREVEPPR